MWTMTHLSAGLLVLSLTTIRVGVSRPYYQGLGGRLPMEKKLQLDEFWLSSQKPAAGGGNSSVCPLLFGSSLVGRLIWTYL